MNLFEHKRGLKYIVIVYVFLSLLYTGNRLYNSQLIHFSQTTTRRSIIDPTSEIQRQDTFFIAPITQNTIETDEHEDVKQMDRFNAQLKRVTEANSVLQNKAFSGAMGPSSIQPFFSKGTKSFGNEDITISTIVTSDRFSVLSRLATRYKGPISAAIHVNDDESKNTILELLANTIQENPDMKKYVDVHLIVDKYDRQFNMWRNTAKLYARTDYVMMLDIDFYLCTDFRKDILHNPELMNMLREGHTALVIPAFEYLDQVDGIDATHFPKNKEELMEQVLDQEKLDMFHAAWQPGHGSTDYGKWYTASEPYKVEEYSYSYEPYVIFKKQGSPWCDERFIGYGANKAACLYEIYLSGMDYYVLPNDFLIHQSHFYPESTRKRERMFNRKVYQHFREELCLRYARQFIADGDWDSSRADNLHTECQKVRGFETLMRDINN